MIRNIYQWAFIMLGMTFALGVPCVLAIPVPPFDLQSLAQRSDLIVVATVDRTDAVGTSAVKLGDKEIDAQIIQAELGVVTVLKGSVSGSRLSAQYLAPSLPIGYRTVGIGQLRVLFLAVKDGGGYTFADAHFPSLPATVGANTSDSDPLGRVLDEERSVLASPTSAVTDKEEALHAIGSAKDIRALSALLPGLSDLSTTVRLETAGELAAHNNVQGASIACEALLEPPKEAPAYVLHNLRVGIRDGVKDEQAIPCLTQLLQSKDDSTREAAASALRHTGTLAAVSPLAAALDDPDEHVRYQAVAGLAEISGQLQWRPNLIQFHQDGGKFTDHWKAWVSAH